MNPRGFCRERLFHKTLALTYSFDPAFFEQVILPDLWAGRSGDILVMVDREQAAAATSAHAGQLSHLGKSYLLAAAAHRSAFHPKLMLRIGAKDASILIGSGNLTSSGWGGNKELGVSWRIGPGHADQGTWLNAFLADVAGWCSDELERAAVSRMQDAPWLASSTSRNTSSSVLYSRGPLSLGAQLASRWKGRTFASVKVFTGSTDESGAFLRWAYRTFGVSDATVVVTPPMASFDPAQLSDLPVRLKLIPAPFDRPLHAKFYWFEGEEGAAAVMGSANCSAAAWLLAPANGGNIETVVVYDDAGRQDWEHLLPVFDRADTMPLAMLAAKRRVRSEPPSRQDGYRITSLQWDNEQAQVVATLLPALPAGASVQLQIGTESIDLSAVDAARHRWAGPLSELPRAGTAFGTVCIEAEGERHVTIPRWLDDLTCLRNASQAARLITPFKAMETAATPTEQRLMLEDLQEVAHALFNDAGAFRDPGASDPGKQQAAAADAAPVSPHDLICELDSEFDASFALPQGRPGGFSLNGILRLLFDIEGDVQPTVHAGAEKAGGPALEGEDAWSASGGSTPPNEVNRAIEPRFRERLATQLKEFLSALRSREFEGRCTATQMVQAVSFPLAVALRGQRRGWVSPDLAEAWVLEVISLLFRSTSIGEGGLLHEVERRYLAHGQGGVFREVVGEGALWLVLVSALGSSRWLGLGASLEKAIALREVFTSPQLVATARRPNVSELLGKLHVQNAGWYVRTVAPLVTKLLGELEAQLRGIWQKEMAEQTARKITQRPGDLLWREGVGWAVGLEEMTVERNGSARVRLAGVETAVRTGFYVNVSEVARRDETTIRRLLRELFSAIETESTHASV